MSPTLTTALALQSLTLATTPGPVSARVEREAWTMGTRLRIVAEAPVESEAERATEVALREIERLEGILSTWDPSSGLSRVNAAPPGSRLSPAPELVGLLAEAECWAQRSGRAFDPAIGALVDAWGVRVGGRVPDQAELARALAATGPGVLRFDHGDVIRGSGRGWIDAGAFGKGAALRSAARAYRATAARRVLLNLGGQIWAAAPAHAPWSVAVAHPVRRSEVVARLSVYDVAVATSGASERPGHLLDPRTGLRVPPWGSVTVVSADAMDADVLATALFVMGPDLGVDWARTHADVAALFLRPTGGGIEASWTPAMERWLVEATPRSESSDFPVRDRARREIDP